ncbi:MAG: helix-turn-helix domain-containing protein [Clostridia bacterium]|nr:helix-turn-helix domain-containing protein [Clostridia bacterium]
MDEIKVYTVQEVAQVLKVSSKTIYNLIHTDELQAIPVRGHYRIASGALDKFLQGGRNGQERKERICV